MKKQEAFEMSGGTTIRKSPIEHFTPTQFMYGSPYSYIIEYADYAGGSPEKRYGLWQFNDATLKYALFQTGGDKDYNVLSDIAASWENTLREAHHIKNLQTMPRSFWSDDDKAKYPDLETIDDSDGGPNQKPKPKKAVKKPVKKAHSLAIMALFGLFGLIQCTSVINRNLTDDSHSSAKTLDWNGTYKSMTPDDNYSGTVTEITLDTAQKYTIKKTYLDKGAQPARGTEQSGNFSWNKSGNTITLLGIDNQPNTFFVGENRLWELDKKGRKITGSDADKYILNKRMNAAAAMPETPLLTGSWELDYIAGSATEFQELYPRKRPTIIFDTLNNLVSGSTSCNNYVGKLVVKANKIDFSGPLAVTKMACLDSKGNGENLFLQTLKTVNKYSMNADSTLNFIMGDIDIMRFTKK